MLLQHLELTVILVVGSTHYLPYAV